MLFLLIGSFKKGAVPIPQNVELLTNDYVGQPLIPIRTAGVLRGADGQRSGMMMLVELPDFAAAKAFMDDSPFRQAGLYQELKLFNYEPEVDL